MYRHVYKTKFCVASNVELSGILRYCLGILSNLLVLSETCKYFEISWHKAVAHLDFVNMAVTVRCTVRYILTKCCAVSDVELFEI